MQKLDKLTYQMREILIRLKKLEKRAALQRKLEDLPGITVTDILGRSGGISDLSCGGDKTVTDLATPVDDYDAVPKIYADNSGGGSFGHPFAANISLASGAEFTIFDSTSVPSFTNFSFNVGYQYSSGNLIVNNTSISALRAQFNLNRFENQASYNTVANDVAPPFPGILIAAGGNQLITLDGSTDSATAVNILNSITRINLNLAILDSNAPQTESASIELNCHCHVIESPVAGNIEGIHVKGLFLPSNFTTG